MNSKLHDSVKEQICFFISALQLQKERIKKIKTTRQSSGVLDIYHDR